jgi:hypothetical protein
MSYQQGQPPQWPSQQPQQPQTWHPANQGWSPSQPVNSPPPQLPFQPLPPQSQQVYGQPQWHQQPPPQQFVQQAQYGGPTTSNYAPPQQQLQQPPQQFQQTPQKPPKKGFFGRKVGPIPLWVLILVLVIVFIGAASNSGKTNNPSSTDTTQSNSTASSSSNGAAQPTIAPTKAPAQAPAPAPKWTTTQTFTGNGIKKTAIFPVGNDWKLIWSCTPSSFYGGQYNVLVTVYNSDGTPADLAVNTICKSGNTGDSTEEHQGGNVYLDINSEGAWKIQIQELK